MNTLPYKISATSDGAGGFLAITLDKSNLGFSPADTFSSVQVSCQGLDGGSYEVLFKPRSAPDYISFISNALAGDAVLLDKTFVFEAVRVQFSGLGAGAAPVLFATFIKRSF